MKLIYLSPVHWSSYEQRPHFMVRYLVEKVGFKAVMWLNPVPLRLPEWSDFRKWGTVYDQQTAPCARVVVVNVPVLPVEPLPFINRINDIFYKVILKRAKAFVADGPFATGFGKPGRLPIYLLDKLQGAKTTFYDAMDDFPEFYHGIARRKVADWEEELAARVGRIIVSSSWLAEKFSSFRSGRDPVMLKNACKPHGISGVGLSRQGGPPVLGYVGSMGRWFDWDLVCEIAKVNSDLEIHLVGPLFIDSIGSLPANVKLFPPCRHQDTARYMQTFSAGLIPFLRNSLTRGVDPVKFYEYRAMGLPVVSTAFGEMTRRGAKDRVYFVERGNCRAGVMDALKVAASISMEETRAFRSKNSWEKRFAPLADLFC